MKNRADLAKREGVTRARVTQVLDLLLLDGEVLTLFDTALVAPGGTPITEWRARDLLDLDGAEQVRAAERMLGPGSCGPDP